MRNDSANLTIAQENNLLLRAYLVLARRGLSHAVYYRNRHEPLSSLLDVRNFCRDAKPHTLYLVHLKGDMDTPHAMFINGQAANDYLYRMKDYTDEKLAISKVVMTGREYGNLHCNYKRNKTRLD